MPTTFDLDLLDLNARQASSLSRSAMRGLMGMLVLVGISIVLLAMFLRQVETQEEARRRSADAEWLDQTLRFHFRRLESDLGVMALTAQNPNAAATLQPGLLWQSPGVIAFHGWIPAKVQNDTQFWPPSLRKAAEAPADAQSLRTMLKTTRGLQRAAYAGPLPYDAEHGSTLWLAVPLFEQGRFAGDYVAAIQLEPMLTQAIPAWFLNDHRITLANANTLPGTTRYLAPVNLPGTQWRLAVDVLDYQPALAPRAFFSVALLCLLGMLLALYLLWRDIARRRRAESQLQTQIVLRTAMERAVMLGLRAWDLQGRLLYVNQAFCRMVGRSAAELMAEPAPAMGDGATAASSALVEHEREGVLTHRDGHTLSVLEHHAPLTKVDGTVIGWMGSTLDITERKRMEQLAARQQEKLEASGRLIAVGEVASTLAHELNQPLGALSSFATGLRNNLQEQRLRLEDIAPVVERMEQLADKAGRVIHRVNAFARRQEMQRQPLDVLPFMRRVAQQVPLPASMVRDIVLPTNAPPLPADALLLEHALHNLVLNATEWAGQGQAPIPTVRVSLEMDTHMAGLRVEDSGPGIPADQAPRIFDAFESGKPGGMGMGLSICRSIAEAHHGRIDVAHSAALGGAQFTLWLPLQ
ncbi:sensor histidine kinase [Rhodoferax saidenbachensis]|uniref:histidine kinase n=1 Tax=Rhodoferax saidenbachensis TaxID=1484693 RepID=A0A1P8K9A2_9BURK|nr:ATP-binding protein [Rhodoferax saidenbachensis]APW42579.1 PAS domain-containing sensor histidine kinase [Rhodoferax saidenbachensis]